MRRLIFGIVGGAIFLAACSSWHGPAEVRLRNGTAIQCPKGLTFTHNSVECGQDAGSIDIPWSQVAGYATK